MRILLAIWPDVPNHVLVHALIHDVGEVATGDLPFPTKLRNPQLKKIMDEAENGAHLSMCFPWGLPKPQTLDPKEKSVFKVADYIEMWEWAIDEMCLGNQMAKVVRDRCADEIVSLTLTVDSSIASRVDSYMERRTKCSGLLS